MNVTGAQNQQTQFHAPSWDNHPFLKSKTRHAGENGSMPRNVSSTGSGPELKAEFGGWEQYSLGMVMSTTAYFSLAKIR